MCDRKSDILRMSEFNDRANPKKIQIRKGFVMGIKGVPGVWIYGLEAALFRGVSDGAGVTFWYHIIYTFTNNTDNCPGNRGGPKFGLRGRVMAVIDTTRRGTAKKIPNAVRQGVAIFGKNRKRKRGRRRNGSGNQKKKKRGRRKSGPDRRMSLNRGRR